MSNFTKSKSTPLLVTLGAAALLFGGLFALSQTYAASDESKMSTKTKSGSPEENAYAAKIWEYMDENGLVGDDRIRSHTFEGSRPHGTIQDVTVVPEAEIEGHTGRLIVKHSYGSEDKKLTVQGVYKGSQSEDLENVSILFQREEGYDAENNDLFWAEYNPDSSIIVYQGSSISGRVPLCIGCHKALGGSDREIINGRE